MQQLRIPMKPKVVHPPSSTVAVNRHEEGRKRMEKIRKLVREISRRLKVNKPTSAHRLHPEGNPAGSLPSTSSEQPENDPIVRKATRPAPPSQGIKTKAPPFSELALVPTKDPGIRRVAALPDPVASLPKPVPVICTRAQLVEKLYYERRPFPQWLQEAAQELRPAGVPGRFRYLGGLESGLTRWVTIRKFFILCFFFSVL